MPKSIEVSLENKGLLFETPNILQIQCRNIASYPFDSEFSKTIGVISVNEKNKYSSFHHTFKGNEFYAFENRLNKNFEILITDEEGSRVKIYQGVPTILEISVIESKMENEINVTCTSNPSIFHPKNCPTEFTSILSTPLELNEEWKVALSCITFKNDFKFDSSFNFKFSYFQYDTSGNEVLKRTNIKIDENVKSVQHIFEIFSNALKVHVDDSAESADVTAEVQTHQVGFVNVSSEGILTIYFTQATKFTLTPHLAMVLGVISNPFDSADIKYQEESVEYEIGLEVNSQNSHTGGIFIGSTPIDFNFSLDQKFMFVQMGALKDIPIGNGNEELYWSPLFHNLHQFSHRVTTSDIR